MQKTDVKFTIPKGGGIRFEVMNGNGTNCAVVTKDIELHLQQAGSVTSEGNKPEYYNSDPDLRIFQDLQ